MNKLAFLDTETTSLRHDRRAWEVGLTIRQYVELNFDTEVLGNRMRANGICPSWHYHLVDVETLAAGALKQPPPWNFDKLLAAYELTYDEADRHTALGDARMVRDLYDAVMAGGSNG